MATGQITLPPGFELDEQSGPNLPDGFELDAPGNKDPQWSDLPGNAMGELKDMGRSAIANAPGAAKFVATHLGNPVIEQSKASLESAMDVARGKPAMETPVGQEVSAIGGAAGGLLDSARELAHNPKEAIIRHPVQHASELMALAGLAGEKLGATGRIGEAAQDVVNPVENAAGWTAKKMMSSILGPSEDAITERLNRNAAIRSAKPYSQLAQELPDEMGGVQSKLSAEDKAAWDTLRSGNHPDEGAMNKKSILNVIRGLKGELGIEGGGVVGESAQRAVKVLDNIAENIQGLGKRVKGYVANPDLTPGEAFQGKGLDPASNYISERSIRGLIQTLDDNVNWEDPLASKTNEVLKRFRQSLDETLKTQNPKYAEIMGPVADKTSLLGDLQSAMRVENAKGGGFAPSDTTENIFKSVGAEKRSSTQEILNRLKDQSGRDFVQDAKDSNTASQFESGKTKRLLGVMDFEGGKIAGHMIDWYVENKPDIFGKFAPALQAATIRGPQSLAATHFLLQHNDPEYQSLMENLSNGGNK